LNTEINLKNEENIKHIQSYTENVICEVKSNLNLVLSKIEREDFYSSLLDKIKKINENQDIVFNSINKDFNNTLYILEETNKISKMFDNDRNYPINNNLSKYLLFL